MNKVETNERREISYSIKVLRNGNKVFKIIRFDFDSIIKTI